jgi:WD40 repeat protein
VAWSSDGTLLAVAFQTSPYILIYTVSGSTFTAQSNPLSLPAGNGMGVHFSPTNQFLAISVASSPYIQVYQTAGSMPTVGVLYCRNFLDV